MVSGLVVMAATFALAAEGPDPRADRISGHEGRGRRAGRASAGLPLPQRVPKPSPWQAKWIWLARRSRCGRSACFARRSRWPKRRRQVKGLADGRYEIPPVRQWPAGVARAGGHRPRLCRRRDASLVLRFPRPDAVFHKGTNVIAAEVFRHWPIGSPFRAASRGFCSRRK